METSWTADWVIREEERFCPHCECYRMVTLPILVQLKRERQCITCETVFSLSNNASARAGSEGSGSHLKKSNPTNKFETEDLLSSNDLGVRYDPEKIIVTSPAKIDFWAPIIRNDAELSVFPNRAPTPPARYSSSRSPKIPTSPILNKSWSPIVSNDTMLSDFLYRAPTPPAAHPPSKSPEFSTSMEKRRSRGEYEARNAEYGHRVKDIFHDTLPPYHANLQSQLSSPSRAPVNSQDYGNPSSDSRPVSYGFRQVPESYQYPEAEYRRKEDFASASRTSFQASDPLAFQPTSRLGQPSDGRTPQFGKVERSNREYYPTQPSFQANPHSSQPFKPPQFADFERSNRTHYPTQPSFQANPHSSQPFNPPQFADFERSNRTHYPTQPPFQPNPRSSQPSSHRQSLLKSYRSNLPARIDSTNQGFRPESNFSSGLNRTTGHSGLPPPPGGYGQQPQPASRFPQSTIVQSSYPTRTTTLPQQGSWAQPPPLGVWCTCRSMCPPGKGCFCGGKGASSWQ